MGSLVRYHTVIVIRKSNIIINSFYSSLEHRPASTRKLNSIKYILIVSTVRMFVYTPCHLSKNSDMYISEFAHQQIYIRKLTVFRDVAPCRQKLTKVSEAQIPSIIKVIALMMDMTLPLKGTKCSDVIICYWNKNVVLEILCITCENVWIYPISSHIRQKYIWGFIGCLKYIDHALLITHRDLWAHSSSDCG